MCTRCRRSRRSWTRSGSWASGFKSADLERGHIRGTRQRLPFYQEIEFFAPQQYRGLNQVELTLRRGRPRDGRRPGDGQEAGAVQRGQRHLPVLQGGPDDFQETDWAAYLNQWLAEVGGKRNWF